MQLKQAICRLQEGYVTFLLYQIGIAVRRYLNEITFHNKLKLILTTRLSFLYWIIQYIHRSKKIFINQIILKGWLCAP